MALLSWLQVIRSFEDELLDRPFPALRHDRPPTVEFRGSELGKCM